MNWFWRYSVEERWKLWREGDWGIYYCSIWCLITDTKLCGGRPGHRKR